MDGFFLLCGHLVGDYLLQTDWMAANKTAPPPGPEPHPNRSWLTPAPTPPRPYPGPWSVDADPLDREAFGAALDARNAKVHAWDKAEGERVAAEEAEAPELAAQRAWWAKRDAYRRGHVACTAHCLLYTLAVWLFACWWMPWWGAAACFLAHWPVDRFRLAGRWMRDVSGQAAFAANFTPPNLPWGVIVVDNVFHLLTLAAVAAAAGRVGP